MCGSAILEGEAGGSRERPREVGDEDLVRAGHGHDPRRLVDGHAAHVVADHLHLADVDADPDLEPVLVRNSPDAAAKSSARAEPSNVASIPSPVVLTSRPPKRSSRAGSPRRSESRSRQAPSPSRAASSVELTRSVKTGSSARGCSASGPAQGRSPLHSTCTIGSSPTVYPSCPGGMSTRRRGRRRQSSRPGSRCRAGRRR